MNPLTGIWVTHHTALGYRHASPDEESLPLPIEGNHSEVHQQTANYSLLTGLSPSPPKNATPQPA